MDLGERRVGVDDRAERREGKPFLLREDDLAEEVARARVDDRGAEDAAPRVYDHLHEVRAGRAVADRPVVVRERGAEDAVGNALRLRILLERPTRAISGSVYVIHGVFATSHFASATGESVFRSTIPAW